MASGASLLASYPLPCPSSDEYRSLDAFWIYQSSKRYAPSRLLVSRTQHRQMCRCACLLLHVFGLKVPCLQGWDVGLGWLLLLCGSELRCNSCMQVLNRIAPAQGLPI